MTINRYFKGRDNLLSETEEFCLNLFVDKVKTPMKSGKSSLEVLKEILVALIPLHLHITFLIRFSEWDDYNVNEDSEFMKTCYEIGVVVEQAKKEGLLRADFPEEWITTFLIYVAFGIGDVNEYGAIAPKKSAEFAIESFLYGVSPRPEKS
jgi:hypothetical protein